MKNVNTHSKTVDKLTPTDEYIDESGILTVICLQMQSNESNADCLKYAYCRPAGKSIDTNLLDHEKMFKLKGMHITLASMIEKIANEKLLSSRIALPRVTLLRTQESTKINLVYEQEGDDLLVKFAIADDLLTPNLTTTQFHHLANALVRVIRFQFHSLGAAFLKVENQFEIQKLLHVISFLLDNQLKSNNQDASSELTVDFYLCEQLTINIELLQCIQQVMIDFECLTWLSQFDKTTIDSVRLYSCLNSTIFYKGKLICSNIYQQQQHHSDLKLYLKLVGLVSLSKLAKTKFVKWMPIYLTNESSNHYLLIIMVEHILYATVWKFSPLKVGKDRMPTIKAPKRLINEALHFIVRLVKKTSLIDEIDYELRLQSYWYSLPISLDEFKEKRGHLLQKSFDFWNALQSTSRAFNLDQFNVQNVNKPNQWRKALMNANIHRGSNLNNVLTSPKNKSKFNLLSVGQSFSIYSSSRSSNSSTVDSLNSNQSRKTLFDQNDPFAGELQIELDALSRALKQIRTFMVDYLVCYLIEDHQNAVYQSPILSSTLVHRLGNSFIKKFKQNCAKLDNQLNFLYPDVEEIGTSFEARLPLLFDNSSKSSTTKKVILPLAKSSPNQFTATKTVREDSQESFKTVKFWLHLIKLNANRTVHLCFLDNHLQQTAINTFLYHNSRNSKFR